MEGLEEWEKQELKSPDCDGAYWMIDRGRREYLEKCLEVEEKNEQ